ncbi:MAG TPA: zinc-binding dehydrogenase [Solirubrobacteraceae bacterium]|jgi:NADPH:quinone reductase-like Zn-dependent oxidoreductase|nr:zinc-binding dehydrogenase [Solirubrobacteraceae bacterium]
MRAAVLHEYGVPRADDFEEPRGDSEAPGGSERAVVEVLAAGLNPVDVAICAGRFYAGKPPLPSVAGREGVGTLDGARVYFDAPVAPFGSMAERALVDPRSTYPVPDGVPDGVAVALGISGLAAWLALTWRAELREGEHVLVLAASGVLGQIAVQAAKLLGATRVVAAARSREGLDRCLALGADAAVRLDEPDGGDLAAALAAAARGRIDVVLDPLFGAPLVAAVNAASFGARLVQIGAGAGAEATLPSAAIRGKMLVLMGHTNFAAPPEVKREAYRGLAEAAARGEIRVETEPLALEQVGEAWERLAAGAHRKVVLVP